MLDTQTLDTREVPTATDLTATQLHKLRDHIQANGDLMVDKTNIVDALVEAGFPRRLHGKHYAKKHVGKVLDLMRREGLVFKNGAQWLISVKAVAGH